MRLFSRFNHIIELMPRGLWQITCSPFSILYSKQRSAFQYLFCKRHCPHYWGTGLSLRNSRSSTAWSQTWKKKKKFFFTALHESTLATPRHPSNIKLTPKSQHDILTVMHCCSLCQGSAHLNSWLMQELDTHPFAGIQPPYGSCLHSSLSGGFLPLHPNMLQVVFPMWWKDDSSFVSSQYARCSPRESSSHMKHS